MTVPLRSRKRIRNLYQFGFSVSELAIMYEVSERQIENILEAPEWWDL